MLCTWPDVPNLKHIHKQEDGTKRTTETTMKQSQAETLRYSILALSPTTEAPLNGVWVMHVCAHTHTHAHPNVSGVEMKESCIQFFNHFLWLQQVLAWQRQTPRASTQRKMVWSSPWVLAPKQTSPTPACSTMSILSVWAVLWTWRLLLLFVFVHLVAFCIIAPCRWFWKFVCFLWVIFAYMLICLSLSVSLSHTHTHIHMHSLLCPSLKHMDMHAHTHTHTFSLWFSLSLCGCGCLYNLYPHAITSSCNVRDCVFYK